ncbi:hypothetical protein PAPHI01_1159 [Pancytospora philotis]|nr:hypothetical protein PAPHI01_1159 [Pancytospora philotis]
MLVPPALDTKDREAHDLNDLRVYYMLCEELGIANDEEVQKSFKCLINWAGKFKFVEEFTIFKQHVDRRKKELCR